MVWLVRATLQFHLSLLYFLHIKTPPLKKALFRSEFMTSRHRCGNLTTAPSHFVFSGKLKTQDLQRNTTKRNRTHATEDDPVPDTLRIRIGAAVCPGDNLVGQHRHARVTAGSEVAIRCRGGELVGWTTADNLCTRVVEFS